MKALKDNAAASRAAQFDALVLCYQDRALGYAYSLTSGDYALAQDLAQEAFLAAWQKWDSLRTPEAFGGWLRRIIFSLSANHRRGRLARVVPFDACQYAAPPTGEPEHVLQQAQQKATVRRAVAALPQGERDAVSLFYLFQASRDETAAFLNISPDAVKKRLQRARTKLHKELFAMIYDDLPVRPSNNPQFLRDLQTQIAERDALARQIHAALKSDSRVCAAWFFTNTETGDLAHLGGATNPWHPLHVQAVVDAEHIQAFIAGRRDYAARIGTPLLVVEAPQNAPRGGAYLMAIYDGETGPYEVDWYFELCGPETKTPQQVRVLFDRIGLPQGDKPTPFNNSEPTQWDNEAEVNRTLEQKKREETRNVTSVFWAMWLISARYIVRQRSDEPLFLGEMLRGLLQQTRQFAGDTGAVREQTPLSFAAPEKVRLLRQMAAEMEALMPRVTATGGAVPDAAIAARAARYLSRVEKAVTREP